MNSFFIVLSFYSYAPSNYLNLFPIFERTLSVSPSVAEVQTIIVTADSQVSGSFKIKFHFPSIRNPTVVDGIDLSLPNTHETTDLLWNFGSDGPTVPSIQSAFTNFVGVTDIVAQPVVSVGGTFTYKWDVTFTHLQQIDSGDVDMMVIESSLFGTNVQTSVVEKIKSTSKTYQKISLLPNGDSEMEGSFTVSFRSHTTAILSYDVSDTDLKIQLETLLSIGVVSVTRTGSIVLGYSWTIVFENNIGTLPLLTTNSLMLTKGTVSVTSIFASPSIDLSGTFTMSYDGSASTTPVSYNADASEIRNALQGITGMPTGIVDISTSATDHNNMHTWQITFVTLRGNAAEIAVDPSGIICSTGVAYDSTTTTFVAIPNMNVLEIESGTYMSGTFTLSLLGHTVTLPFDTSENDMRLAVDSRLAAANYLSTALSTVTRIGPNRKGAYQWHITIPNVGAIHNDRKDVPLFVVDGDQLACDGRVTCTSSATVTSVNKGEVSWQQEIKLEANHLREIQHITVSSHAQVFEKQIISIFATKGFFQLSIGSYFIQEKISFLPTFTLATRIEHVLENVVNIGDVDVLSSTVGTLDTVGILNTLDTVDAVDAANAGMNVTVTFLNLNGDVPLIGIQSLPCVNDTTIQSCLVYETYDNNVLSGTIPATAFTIESEKGIACEEQAIELLTGDATAAGYFTCTFGTDPTISNPIAFDGSANEMKKVLSQLPLLGPVEVTLSPTVMSTPGSSAGGSANNAVYRRWDVSFVNYVGTPPYLLICTVGTAISTVSSSSSLASVRVTRVKLGEGRPATGTFGVGFGAGGLNQLSTANTIGSTTTGAVLVTSMTAALGNNVQGIEIERQIYGYGATDQYKYIVTWPVSTSITGLVATADFASGTSPSATVHVMSKSTINEIQTITSSASTTTFVISFNGQETTNVFTSSSTALNIQQGINALTSVGVVAVTSSGTPPTVTWSITFVQPSSKGGSVGISSSRTSHTKCMYNNENNQCRQSYNHAHSCRQHDGTSRSICSRSSTTGSTSGLNSGLNSETIFPCTWDEGTQLCIQSSLVVGDDFQCRMYDGDDTKCGAVGYDFPKIEAIGTGLSVNVIQPGTLSPLEGTFVLSHGKNTIRLPHDVTALGLKSSLEDVLNVGQVTVTNVPSLVHPKGWVSKTWNIKYDEYSAISMSIQSIDVHAITSVPVSGAINAAMITVQEATVTHLEVKHSHLRQGDTVHIVDTSSLVSGFDRYWTVLSVVSATQFKMNVLELNRPGIGKGRYQHSNFATDGTSIIGKAVKEPIVTMDTLQIYSTGSLTTTSLTIQEGSNTCCAQGSFKLAHSIPNVQLPGKIFALAGSPVIQTTNDLTANNLLFRGSFIAINGVTYQLLENGLFSNTTLVLNRNYIGTTSPVSGDVAHYSEYTSMLPLDASAVSVDHALSQLSAFSSINGGVSVIRSLPNKNNGYTWTVTFLKSRQDGNVELLNVGLLNGIDTLKTVTGPTVEINVNEVVPGSLASIQSITTHSQSKLMGTFTLTFNQFTTNPMRYDSTALEMKKNLELIHSIGRVDVSRSDPTPTDGYTWLVTFLSSAGIQQELLVGDTGKLTDSEGSTLKGVSSDDATIIVTRTRDSTTLPLSGTFALKFRGASTVPLAYDATGTEVKAALEELGSNTGVGRYAGQLNVSVTRIR